MLKRFYPPSEFAPNKKRKVPVNAVPLIELHRLWHHSDLRAEEVAIELGVSLSSVRRLVREHKVGSRPRVALQRMRLQPDPTPEEIAERAAECRARRLIHPIDESDCF